MNYKILNLKALALVLCLAAFPYSGMSNKPVNVDSDPLYPTTGSYQSMPGGDDEKCPIKDHPNSKKWDKLFKDDLSDAIDPKNIWTYEDGVLTASEDINIWTEKEYKDVMIDLEFKTDEGTNSGVVVYCTNIDNWIPNSVEIQIADDFSKQWSESPKTWQCAAIFGHLAATESAVKRPGEWNRMTVVCKGQMIWVLLNGKQVNEMDMSLWTSGKVNPDGSEIPSWLSTPFAELATHGRIGLQGKHAGAPIFFRNLKVKEL